MKFTPDLGTVVGANVARHREELGWTQHDLLTKLVYTGAAWSPSAVSLLENRGARGERLSDLAELCYVLKVPIWDLLGEDPVDVEMRSGTVRNMAWIVKALKGEHQRGDD